MIHRAVYRVETIIHHTPLRSDARFVENRPPSLNKRPTGRVHDRRVNYYCHESWSSSHRLIHIPISPERRPWVSILVPIPQMTPHWPRRRYPYCGPATLTSTTPAAVGKQRMDLLGGDTHSAAHGRFFKYIYICHYNHQHELLKMVGRFIYMCVYIYMDYMIRPLLRKL